MPQFNYQPQKRDWLDKVNDFALEFIDWMESPKVKKTANRILWTFLIVAILYILFKTGYDLRHNYQPTNL